MTTITVPRPPLKPGSRPRRWPRTDPASGTVPTRRTIGSTHAHEPRIVDLEQKKAPGPVQVPGPWCVLWKIAADGLDSALGPATWMNPGKVQDHHQPRSEARPSSRRTESRGSRPQHPRIVEPIYDRNQDQARTMYRAWPYPADQAERCGCPTGNPSAAVRRAASGCHYTRDHLLLLKPPRSRGSPASSESGL